MCKTHNPRKIDKCMKILIQMLNKYLKDDIKIIACCCGHNKYPMSIIAEQSYANGELFRWDICSDTLIPRKKRFYVKDGVKDGQSYYYIPETVLPTELN